MSGLQVDLPYPSTTDFMRDECSVRIISPAYAGGASEMTAILQYIYHAVHFDCAGNKKFARILRDIAITEMHHLDMLAEMFCAMGVSPVYSACPPCFCDFYSTRNVSYSCTPQRMIMDDINGEREAIRDYERMLCKLKNEQAGAVISRIILDEQLHLETLKRMLDELVNC
ncbi:hypothetical protein ESZ91_01350 [Candidatus Borkfalkia ceftriaxoniphila]|uniref:Ferritin/DPS domain-containing protein n=1 Tax=Candidatus Borkfalkia ceftriaxoniphila TaxID=2508949 RepID=A0A4Q2K8N7_9FIRM|nr:ferritin-like domain-containing protein [Candidatus Borkfalkia ceftriaxoniphila]RXZ61054.1 hypothetical protein ESZ91_01350 [Candidatus Borkfalkia ceftriaxoniphila]